MFSKTPAMVLLVAVCFGQETVLRSKSELVLAPVSITDRGGRYVRDLSEEDLAVYDDNVVMRIRLEDVTLPISLAIVVQTTPESQIVLDKLRKATGVIGPMITGFQGEAAVIAFGRSVEVKQPFTSNDVEIAGAIRRLDAAGSGAGVADAVTAGLKLLAARPKERRRVLLVLSEKHDFSSNKERIGAAALLAQRENVTVYSMTFSPSVSQWTNKVPVYCDPPPPSFKCRRCTCGNCGNQCDREDGKPQEYVPPQAAYGLNLGALSEAVAKAAQPNSGEILAQFTGGEQISFATKTGLEGVLEKIGRDVHGQYLVSYQAPHAGPGRFHRIRVEVRTEGKVRRDLVVRARPGYWESE
jgi:hypothetical protein